MPATQKVLLCIPAALLLSSCITTSLVDRNASKPAALYMDVSPGYYQTAMFLVDRTEDMDEMHYQARITEFNPSKKWSPTVSTCLVKHLHLEDGKAMYCVYLSHDMALKQNYGRIRLISEDENIDATKTTPGLFSATKLTDIRLTMEGRTVAAYFDGALLDRRDLDFDPVVYRVGGSSGKVEIHFIADPPPPAPE